MSLIHLRHTFESLDGGEMRRMSAVFQSRDLGHLLLCFLASRSHTEETASYIEWSVNMGQVIYLH